jgi:hypothetical protein
MLMLRALVCLIALTSATVQIAEAQRRAPPPPPRPIFPAPPVEFGVRGGFDFDESTGSAGAQVRIPLGAPIFLVPSGDVYFNDARTQWQVNGDLLFQPRELGGIYAGVGAAFVNRDFDTPGERATRAGFNLVAGLRGARLSGTSVRPFAEGRWTQVADYRPFRLALGIDVPVSGR